MQLLYYLLLNIMLLLRNWKATMPDDNADNGFYFSDVILCLLKHVDSMMIL